MWFWWYIFVVNMLYPLVMIIAGRFMWKHCSQAGINLSSATEAGVL